MWALDGSAIGSHKAVALLDVWKTQHWLHSNLWLPLHQAAHFHVHPLTHGAPHAHLTLPMTLLSHQPPRAVPFSRLDPALQGTLIRSCPPPFSPRGFPMLVEPSADKDVGFLWRRASAGEFLDGCLFPRVGESAPNGLLADPRLTHDAGWPHGSVRLLNIQETTNPFAIDASLAHLDLISQTPLPRAYSSGLTTVAAQFAYASLMWLEADQLNHHGLAVAADQRMSVAHRVSVTEEAALYHVSQLTEAEQERWLARIPRFVLLNSLTTAFVLFRGRWHTAKRFGLTTAPCLADMHRVHRTHARDAPQPLLWVCPWEKRPTETEEHFTDGFTGSPLVCERNYFASFFNASQLTGL